VRSLSCTPLLLLLVAGALGVAVGCNGSPGEDDGGATQTQAPAPRPDRFLGELAVPGGSEWLHTCGENLVSISRKSHVYVREWNALLKAPAEGMGEGSLTAFLLPNLLVADIDTPYGPFPIVLKNMDTGAELRRWELTPWYCDGMRTSRNGRFVALRVRSTDPPWRVRLGRLDAESKQPRWAAMMTQSRGTLMISHVAPSDDGRYIAAAGIHDGAWIAVADVAAKKLLWGKRQEGAVKFYDVAFSPDAKTVYARGTSGGLFAYDVATGALTKRYAMGGGLDEQYGYRVTRVATSPDGRLVAAGTGSGGAVHVWRAGTGTRVLSFGTRQATIMGLAFSPDSTRLAVTGVANRTVGIWDVTAGRTAPRLQPSGREDLVAGLGQRAGEGR
jgi:hypothetical protein